MKLLVTIAILLVIVAVFGGAMFALNMYTGPIIEANQAGAANDRLNAVMDGGKAYEDITATLSGVPEGFKVNKETSGLGFVIEAQATSQYTGGSPMDIVIGVDATGTICGIKLVSHSESLIFGATYPDSYVGKDSALAGVELYAGSTYSSKAFKGAVEEALGVLISNDLIKAGVKSDAQILEELVPTVAPGFTKLVEAAAAGNIQMAFKAENGAGFAYIMTAGEKSYLAVVNAMGACKLYDVEGNDVTADNAALADEAKTQAAANQQNFESKATRKFKNLFDGADGFETLTLDGFNTIVYAAKFTVGDADYYGFYSRSKGYDQMDVYVIIDENGAIVKISAATLFFDTEHFPVDDTVDSKEYENSFAGLTGDTFTGDNAMISGATMTSNAMKQSTNDAFAAFNSIKGGEQ